MWPLQPFKCSLKICYPLLPYSQRKKRCRRAKICDLCTAGGPLQLKHQKSADMKYLADNFQDNCQGWIFQMAKAAFFRLSGPDFSLQIDRARCNQLNQTPLINAKCLDHIYVIACNNLITKRHKTQFQMSISEHLK